MTSAESLEAAHAEHRRQEARTLRDRRLRANLAFAFRWIGGSAAAFGLLHPVIDLMTRAL